MRLNKFKCAKCGGVFEKGRSDEETQAEAEDLWTPEELKDTVTICDNCFKIMMNSIVKH